VWWWPRLDQSQVVKWECWVHQLDDASTVMKAFPVITIGEPKSQPKSEHGRQMEDKSTLTRISMGLSGGLDL
jgi:hypothetical protein